MFKALAIVLLAAVAVQARFVPEIQDAAVRWPEIMRMSNIKFVGDASEHDGKIVGGVAAIDNQFPYQCHLSIRVGVNNYFCGCSLIGPAGATSVATILTAAHCPDKSNSVSVTIGDTSRTGPDGEVTVTVQTTNATVRVHENWGSVRIINDIALIFIPATPINLDEGKDIICLAKNANEDGQVNEIVRVSGWGKTSDTGSVAIDLQYVDVAVISNTECAVTYGATVTAGNICTSTKTNQGTCNGDSGGPLVTLNADKTAKKQIGIVSFGASASCANQAAGAGPSAFSRVTYFHDWIVRNVGGENLIC